MKPRLKLLLNGQLLVVRPGVSFRTGGAARAWIRAKYGTVQLYCARHRLPYGAASVALKDRPHAARMAGLVRQARLVIGLPVAEPSAISLKLAAHAEQRHKGKGCTA